MSQNDVEVAAHGAHPSKARVVAESSELDRVAVELRFWPFSEAKNENWERALNFIGHKKTRPNQSIQNHGRMAAHTTRHAGGGMALGSRLKRV